MVAASARNYEEWRNMARGFLQRDIHPRDVNWQDGVSLQANLFTPPTSPAPAGAHFTSPASGQQVAPWTPACAGESGVDKVRESVIKIPKAFLTLAERVACHRDPQRNGLLYLALWRLTHGEKHLLELSTDRLVHQLLMMQKAVSRDAHKAKAFVRFRLTNEDGEEHYIAWHNPDHMILPLVAPFFMRRFSVMKWTILTIDQSVSWDSETLQYGPGVPRSEAPDQDVLEDMWKAYYRSTFNPARIKLKMMRSEMPLRHWATLPETSMIPSMLKEAPDRVAEMLKYAEGIAESAASFVPPERTIPILREAAKACRGCPLHQCATQTVFGTGPENARMMVVGEQPGDNEDLQGLPFVGPAGEVLNNALAEAEVVREQLYMTNAVKHFKFTQTGQRRIHQSPNVREINACKPWLQAEIETVRPQVILALGLTAARSLVGPGFTLKDGRGKWLDVGGRRILCTYHPSAVLRMPDEAQKAQIYQSLVADIQTAIQGVSE